VKFELDLYELSVPNKKPIKLKQEVRHFESTDEISFPEEEYGSVKITPFRTKK
jgi:hypothetical protein